MNDKVLHLDNLPESNKIWKEIGVNYDDAGQVINEFVDNAVSSIISKKTEKGIIEITLEETNDIDQAINVIIEDSGNGIENPVEAFTLGATGNNSVINEHGLGMKQALSAANPENDGWEVFIRNNEITSGNAVMYIHAPYNIGRQQYTLLSPEKYPGYEWSNTYIKVRCRRTLFTNMIDMEPFVRESMGFGLNDLADRIHEELGFTYAGVIEKYGICIRLILRHSDNTISEHEVTPLRPDWIEEPVYIMNEHLRFECRNGRIKALPSRIPFDNATAGHYYNCQMESSGVELRIKGRVVEYNLFEEIFGTKNHSSYNDFCLQVNLLSDTVFDVPATKTVKNEFRIGDERLSRIYTWLRMYMRPSRKTPQKQTSVTELDQKKKLAEILENQYMAGNDFELSSEGRISTREVPLFTSFLKSGYPKADLIVKENGKVTIFEAKKKEAGILDLYQLKMYCDGFRRDNGKMPDYAILVAEDFPESLARFKSCFNEDNPDCPPIQFKKWNDYMENFVEQVRHEKESKMKY